MLYVLAKDTGTWHWCQTCSQYPGGTNFGDRSFDRPASNLCEECIQRDREGRCGSQQENLTGGG